jgi:hypothetical protein
MPPILTALPLPEACVVMLAGEERVRPPAPEVVIYACVMELELLGHVRASPAVVDGDGLVKRLQRLQSRIAFQLEVIDESSPPGILNDCLQRLPSPGNVGPDSLKRAMGDLDLPERYVEKLAVDGWFAPSGKRSAFRRRNLYTALKAPQAAAMWSALFSHLLDEGAWTDRDAALAALLTARSGQGSRYALRSFQPDDMRALPKDERNAQLARALARAEELRDANLIAHSLYEYRKTIENAG